MELGAVVPGLCRRPDAVEVERGAAEPVDEAARRLDGRGDEEGGGDGCPSVAFVGLCLSVQAQQSLLFAADAPYRPSATLTRGRRHAPACRRSDVTKPIVTPPSKFMD